MIGTNVGQKLCWEVVCYTLVGWSLARCRCLASLLEDSWDNSTTWDPITMKPCGIAFNLMLKVSELEQTLYLLSSVFGG